MKASLSATPAQSRQLKEQFANPEDKLSYELGQAVQELPPLYTRILAVTISAVVFGTIGWAHFSKIDEVATAEGKLIPSTEVRPVRAMSLGSVSSVKVKPGDEVKKDQVLVEIDPGASETSVAAIEKDIIKIQENITRLEAESQGRSVAVNTEQSALLAARQQELLQKQSSAQSEANRQAATITEGQARLERFRENIINARTTKANAEKSLINAQQAKVNASRSLEKSRTILAKLEPLNREGAMTSKDYTDAEKVVIGEENQVNSADNQITTASNQVTEADNQIITLEKEIEAQLDRITQAQQGYQAAQSTAAGIGPQRTGEVLNQLTQQRQELTKKKGELELAKKQQTDRETVRAPFDGVVFNQKVTQGPVQQGEELLSILPKNQDLVMEVKITNRDIGFIQPGMRAKIKLATFPFQEFGIIEGEVLQISSDAVVEKDAQGRDMGPVFPARIQLKQTSAKLRGREVEFTPGMAGSAEVVTRQKSILSFVTEPITKRFNEAFSVR
jgi:HlyD family secretion protein